MDYICIIGPVNYKMDFISDSALCCATIKLYFVEDRRNLLEEIA